MGCVVAEQKSCVRWQAAEWPELCAELQCGHTTSPAVAMPGPVLLCPTSVAAAFPSADYLLDELESIAADARRLASPRLAGAVRRAVGDLFTLYPSTLAAALNRQLRAPGCGSEAQERCVQGGCFADGWGWAALY